MLGLPEDDNLGLLREEEAGAENRNAESCRRRAGASENRRGGETVRSKTEAKPLFPKRRGVLINTSPGHDSQPCFCMMAGFCTPQSSLYMTRAEALKKFS